MDCEGDWGKSCDLNPLLQLWLLVLSDKVMLKYTLWWDWLGLVWCRIEMSWLWLWGVGLRCKCYKNGEWFTNVPYHDMRMLMC